MRDVSRVMLRVIQSEAFKPVEMLQLRIAGTSAAATQYFTNGGEQFTWGGQTYLPINFSRSEVGEVLSTDSGDKPSVTITIQNVDGQFGQLLRHIDIVGSKATLYLHDRRLLLKYPTRTRDAVMLLSGEVRNPVVSSTVLTFDVVGVLGMLDNISLPRRLFQPQCNYTFGSAACGVDTSQAPYRLATTILSRSTREFLRVGNSLLVDAGNPDDPTEFWKNGYVFFTDGECIAQGASIQRVVASGGQRRIYVRSPFRGNPAAGDGIIVLRGCGKTPEDCNSRQGNVNNFGGFQEVPYGDIKPATPIAGF